ncbi:MAG: glycoside hydrolase [Chloroflexi bacterium]|nr:glycoside hydrolase [Chloroflexota bacterium]
MQNWKRFFCLVMAVALLVGCAPPPTPSVPTATTPPSTATPVPEEPLYLSIIWHQHQPRYYKDPQTGIYSKPWVRCHATKDYYDMAAMLKQYPKIRATFNLTPSLIFQLQDLVAGAKDLYWVLAEKPAASLTEEEKIFILKRFFDANWDHVIRRYPRYKELLAKRGSDDSDATVQKALLSFTEQDFRDLQVWFNLAWFDPDFLAEEPLLSLVNKGRDFSEEDKAVVFAKALEVVKMVLPVHKELQDAGQIEVTFTPYTHPILPLLYDTNLAKIGMPDVKLPERFSFPNDAIAQIQKGIAKYKELFGRDPRGMWPAEGAVAQEIVKMVSDAGVIWMASGEQVLARSLGMDGFTRNSKDVVQEADQLYRPYYVQHGEGRPVGMVFRDLLISDKVGFTYSGMPGQEAAKDFMRRLRDIQARLKEEKATGPHLVTVLLDGENAWEYYENDGKEFLNALYQQLSEATDIVTITPSEYLQKFPEQRKIEKLWAGCWFTPDFSTWIGEDEENQAWNYLLKTRMMLVNRRNTVSEKQFEDAMELMYFAEGSDWFWWYGSDQSVADERAFDTMFRQTLMDVYHTMGEDIPEWLYVPIMPPQPPAPTREISGLFTPVIDGMATDEEWAQAGYYLKSGGAMARAEDVIAALYYGFDKKNIYLRIDGRSDWLTLAPDLTIAVYLSNPHAKQINTFSRYGAAATPKTVLGFGAAGEAAVHIRQGTVSAAYANARGYSEWEKETPLTDVAVRGKVIELAVPFKNLPDLEAGDRINLYIVVSRAQADIDAAPLGGPALLVVPDISAITPILVIDDPEHDDHGPGSYTYPTDGVFLPQCFDGKQFVAGYDENNLVFIFSMYGPVANPWGSAVNLSVQAFDVYIDMDHTAGSGRRLLLPGRNAAVSDEDAWDYAIWVEGWTPGVYKLDTKGNPQKVDVSLKIVVDPPAKKVTVRVPKSAFSSWEPQKWGYLAVVLGQEGYPAAGVWRVRDVEAQSAQWRFGGAPADTNHTRIIDVFLPATALPTQEQLLSNYPASQEKDMDKLTPDDFAQLPMLRVP